MATAKDDGLRFPIGTRVECNLGGTWTSGTVFQHNYTETDLAATSVPYQVALDDGRLVFARRDEDRVIRALLHEPDPVRSIFPQRENRTAVVSSLGGALAHLAFAAIVMRMAEYIATGPIYFIGAEMVDKEQGRLTFDGYGVAAVAAAFAVLGLQTLPAKSSEWLGRAGVTSWNGTPDYPAIALHAILRAVGQEVFYRGALPTFVCAHFPINPEAATAGLILSIVIYPLLHADEHALFAAFSAFWFAIAAYYGGYQGAVLASVLAQVTASALHFGRRGGTETADPEPEEEGTTKEKEGTAEKEEDDEEDEEIWAPMPWLDPLLPAPENRRMVLRCLSKSGFHVALAVILYQFGESLAPPKAGEGAGGQAGGGGGGGLDRPWLRAFGLGMACALAVVGGLDIFSGSYSSGAVAESAKAWLNDRPRRMSRGGRGKPDRIGLLLHALFTGVGHEVLFRGALPRLAVKLSQSGLLPWTVAATDASYYGLIASVVGYYLFHPSELAVFACFAGMWFAVAAHVSGLGAAVLANCVSQVGAASLYFQALIRSLRAERTTTQAGGTPGAAKKGGGEGKVPKGATPPGPEGTTEAKTKKGGKKKNR